MSRRPSRPALAAAAAGAIATAALSLAPSLSPGAAGAIATAAPLGTRSGVVHARATATTPRDPLKVVIRRLTPSVVPTHGDVTVTGLVRNRSRSTWTDLSVYLLTSGQPMTTAAQLTRAVDSDPRAQVGNRIIDTGLYVHVRDLAPGQATPFLLSVPRDKLGISGRPGVYWLGVHVLGTSDEGRLEGADGRARTFLPLVPAANPGTRLALGMQLRAHVVRSADGRLAYPDAWGRLVSRSGRLQRLLQLSSSSDYPLTWLLDPAVLEAVRSTAAGNPPLTLRSGGPTTGTAGPAPGTPAAAAGRWSAEFAAGTASRPVLALPYGDLDVSAAVTNDDPRLISTALALSHTVLDQQSVESSPVVAPPEGRLAPAALGALRPAVGVLLGSGAVTDAPRAPTLRRAGGGHLLLAPSDHDIEGPLPGNVRGALAVRQRLLADAALHTLSGDRTDPLVRLLPARWNPGKGWRAAAFFRGLDVPWLSGVRIPDVLNGPAPRRPRVSAEDVDYPEAAAQEQLPAGTLAASRSLLQSTDTLGELLTEPGNVLQGLQQRALEGASVWNRLLPALAGRRTRNAEDVLRGWLDRITVEGPAFVVVSSESGNSFQVTLVNGLDQPVTIGIRPTVVGGGLRIVPQAPVDLPAHGRGAMQLEVRARGIGVHQVTLQPVTRAGRRFGQPDTLSVRSSHVGAILWAVMAGGAALLFTVIAFRIGHRIRQRRRTHGPLLKRGTA